MIIGFVLMLVVMALLPVAWRTAPGGSVPVSAPAKKGRLLGGFALIAADRYLLLIAMTVVMLNLVNSVGEYLFAHFVEMHAQARVPADAGPQAQAEYVTRVYASFMLGYTTLGLLLQTFLVARLFRWIGIGRSAIILPALMAASYLLIAFIPVFSLIRFVKIAENATDYSLMGTIRQALFLPTSEEAKFDGKTAIDTFFWRVGDLLQAGIVYAGVHWFDWSVRGFALMTAGMCLVFLACSVALSREYRRRVPDDGLVVDGRVVVRPGRHTDTPISEVHDDWPAAGLENIATFVDDGTPLPAWLEFDFSQGKLKARTPDEFSGLMRLRVEGQEPGAGIQRQFPFTLVAVRDH